MAEKNVSLPALPAGQVYIAILDKPFREFCKYNGEVNKAYEAPLSNLNAESIWNLGDQGYRRIMGTVTMPQDGYPDGETRLQHCDDRAAEINANTYGYGAGGSGPKGDLALTILRATVVGIVCYNLTEYKRRKIDAVKEVREDCSGMFRKCCAKQAESLPNESEDSLFDNFWPKHEAESKAEAKRQRENQSKAANAFGPDAFVPTAS